MTNEKRKVYFASITVQKMLENSIIHDSKTIQYIFSQIYNAYQKANKSKDFQSFQKSNVNGDLLFIYDLHYLQNKKFLCGRIGRHSNQVKQFLRENNPHTLSGKELTHSEGNLFEHYSYFVISPTEFRIGYLMNNKISNQIPVLIISVLRNNLGSLPYNLTISDILDSDLKSKIKQLRGNIIVKGKISGQDEAVVGGMRSLKQISRIMGASLKTTINIRAKIGRQFTDSEINEIMQVVRDEEGFDSFTFQEENEENIEKEMIDLVKRQASLSSVIELGPAEQKDQDAIWNKICSVM